jgi:hypothetical protein
MSSRIRSAAFAVLAVLSASSLLAQNSLEVGAPFSLTDTRYATVRGSMPLLLSNGREPVLFWSDGRNVRATRIINGQPSVGQAVLLDGGMDSFDAVWTGAHFLVVATYSGTMGVRRVGGRLVSATGEPFGDPFFIIGSVFDGDALDPHLAFNGTDVLMLCVRSSRDVHAVRLTRDGKLAEPTSRPIGVSSDGRIALTTNGDTFAAVIPRQSDPRLVIFDQNGAVQSESILGSYGMSVSIASDGARYLAVGACTYDVPCGPAYARVVESDGTWGASIDLDPTFRREPSAVWSGSEWVVSYVRDQFLSTILQSVHLDATASAIVKRGDQPDGRGSSMAVIGGRVLSAFVAGRQPVDTIFVRGLENDATVLVPISRTATHQKLIGAVSSHEATLVAWQEIGDHHTTLHVGTRDGQGRWRERQLMDVPKEECCYEQELPASVATDGHQFLILTYRPYGKSLAQRLDADLTPIGDPIDLHGQFFDQVVFDGEGYVLFEGNLAARLSTAGVLTPRTTLSMIDPTARYASDGAGQLYAVWTVYTYTNNFPRATAIAGMRFGANLQPLDAAPRTLSSSENWVGSPDVAFDGSQYSIAWTEPGAMKSAQVPRDGGAPVIRYITEEPVESARVMRVADGVAVAWRTPNPDFGPTVNRLAFVRRDGTLVFPISMSIERDLGRVTALPNGDAAFIEAAVLDGAPYEGSQRIAMRAISTAALPARPERSQTALERSGGGMTLSWTAPAQQVDGYRVEYRVGDAAWIEMEHAYDSAQHAIDVPYSPGIRNSYRVRAWNAAGTGIVSDVISVGNPRRRAVR